MVQEKKASKEMRPGRENAPEKGAKADGKTGRESCRGMDGVMANGMEVEMERKRSWGSRAGREPDAGGEQLFDFAGEARRRMAALGIKPVKLAKKTGYSVQYITDLLLGRRRWNETTINRVCLVLGLRVVIVAAETAETIALAAAAEAEKAARRAEAAEAEAAAEITSPC